VQAGGAGQHLQLGKRSICPPLPRMPVLSSSSRQACWRLVWPLRARLNISQIGL
jgi:hypothetical protein